MGLKLITPSSGLAVSLTEAKAHLRVVDSDDDTLITTYVKAATQYAEEFTGRAFVDQTWDLYLDEFPEAEIKIPLPPLIEIVQIAYDDTAGDEQIIPSGNYYVDTASEPGWVVPAGTLVWPTPIEAINSVRVRFRAGYLDTNSPPATLVPEDLKAAILLTVGSFYEHREQQVVGLIANRMPWGAEQLLRSHRVLIGMA